jgi:probable DNA metabolism protein
MNTVIYDGSFDGLLTAIFEVYEYKLADVTIYKEQSARGNLFGRLHRAYTNKEKSTRVLKSLQLKLTVHACVQFYKAFLSELPSIENTLLRYVQYVLAAKRGAENDFSNPDVLMILQTSRKVDRETHRMKAFVRFELAGDGLYFAVIQPGFDVLLLISKHFEERYADQRWMIYDVNRKYGIYYDLEKVETVEVQFNEDIEDRKGLHLIYDEKETLYQTLWRQYFNSVNIKARKNLKLHIQHMPRRYWKHLVEKRVLPDEE